MTRDVDFFFKQIMLLIQEHYFLREKLFQHRREALTQKIVYQIM
jgi:hypothetical protein